VLLTRAMDSPSDIGVGEATGSEGDSTGSLEFIWFGALDGSEAGGTERNSSQLRFNGVCRLVSSATFLAAVTRSLRLRTFSSSVFARALI